MTLHPPFFLLLAMLGVAVIVSIHYDWVATRLKTDRTRLQEIPPAIVALRDACRMELDPYRESMHRYLGEKSSPSWAVFADIIDLTDTLQRLSIPYPTTSPKHRDYPLDWFNFLARLTPLASTGNLSKARTIAADLPTRSTQVPHENQH